MPSHWSGSAFELDRTGVCGVTLRVTPWLAVRVALVAREAAAMDFDAPLVFEGDAEGNENALALPPEVAGPNDCRSDAASRRDTWACEGAPAAAGSMAIPCLA
jgi:hypothetical protein